MQEVLLLQTQGANIGSSVFAIDCLLPADSAISVRGIITSELRALCLCFAGILPEMRAVPHSSRLRRRGSIHPGNSRICASSYLLCSVWGLGGVQTPLQPPLRMVRFAALLVCEPVRGQDEREESLHHNHHRDSVRRASQHQSARLAASLFRLVTYMQHSRC